MTTSRRNITTHLIYHSPLPSLFFVSCEERQKKGPLKEYLPKKKILTLKKRLYLFPPNKTKTPVTALSDYDYSKVIHTSNIDATMYYQKNLVRRKTKKNIKFVYNQNTMSLQSLLGVDICLTEAPQLSETSSQRQPLLT